MQISGGSWALGMVNVPAHFHKPSGQLAERRLRGPALGRTLRFQ
jgi:hypothetical protein